MELYPSNLKVRNLPNGGREAFNEDYKKHFFMRENEAQERFLKLRPFLEKTRNKEINFTDFLRIYKIFLIIDGEKNP